LTDKEVTQTHNPQNTTTTTTATTFCSTSRGQTDRVWLHLIGLILVNVFQRLVDIKSVQYVQYVQYMCEEKKSDSCGKPSHHHHCRHVHVHVLCRLNHTCTGYITSRKKKEGYDRIAGWITNLSQARKSPPGIGFSFRGIFTVILS
jgi:hypothetical protein